MSKIKEGYKKTKIGVIPEDWKIVIFNDLKDKGDKYSITGGPFGSDLKSEHYTKSGIRVIQLQNIGDGKFINDDFVYTSKEKAQELNNCLVYPNDIIIAKMAEPVARACIVPNLYSKFLMCSDGIRLRIDKSKFNNKFILEIINYETFRKIAIARSSGSTRKRIGLNDLKKIQLAVPPLQEQKKIAQILSTWDRAIEKQEKLIEAKEKLKKGLMQRLLTGEVRFKEFGSGTLVSQNGGVKTPLPSGWEEVRLGEIAKITTGISNREDSSEKGGLYTFFDRSEDIRTSDKYLFDGEAIIVAGEGQKFIPKYFIGKFDLHQRTYAIMNFNYLVVEAKYLFYHIYQNKNYFLSQAVGSTVKSLRLPMFKKMKIKLPSLTEQQKIAKVLSTADREIKLLKKELKELKKQKKGLMQRLLSGEVRVKI